jgi:hypothetical protein
MPAVVRPYKMNHCLTVPEDPMTEDGGNISYINDQSLSCSTEKLTQCRIKAVFKTGVPNNESRTGFGATKTY